MNIEKKTNTEKRYYTETGKMKGGQQMETNDSKLPGVVRGTANRLETDYMLLLSVSLPFFPSLKVMETLHKTAHHVKPMVRH